MKINQSDYQEIMDFMINQCWKGYEFVACPFWNGPISKKELVVFVNQSEAKEFCEEYSTGSVRYGYLPIRSAVRSMSEALQDDRIIVEKGGLVDLLGMVNNYHKKLDEQFVKGNNDLEQFKQKEEEKISQPYEWWQLLHYLQEKYLGGDRFISFHPGEPTNVGDYATYKDISKDDTVRENHIRLPFITVYRAILNGATENNLVLYPNGCIDIYNTLINDQERELGLKNGFRKELREQFRKIVEQSSDKNIQLPPLDKNIDGAKLTLVPRLIPPLDTEINKASSKVKIIAKPKSKEVKDKQIAQLKRKR